MSAEESLLDRKTSTLPPLALQHHPRDLTFTHPDICIPKYFHKNPTVFRQRCDHLQSSLCKCHWGLRQMQWLLFPEEETGFEPRPISNILSSLAMVAHTVTWKWHGSLPGFLFSCSMLLFTSSVHILGSVKKLFLSFLTHLAPHNRLFRRGKREESGKRGKWKSLKRKEKEQIPIFFQTGSRW